MSCTDFFVTSFRQKFVLKQLARRVTLDFGIVLIWKKLCCGFFERKRLIKRLHLFDERFIVEEKKTSTTLLSHKRVSTETLAVKWFSSFFKYSSYSCRISEVATILNYLTNKSGVYFGVLWKIASLQKFDKRRFLTKRKRLLMDRSFFI